MENKNAKDITAKKVLEKAKFEVPGLVDLIDKVKGPDDIDEATNSLGMTPRLFDDFRKLALC